MHNIRMRKITNKLIAIALGIGFATSVGVSFGVVQEAKNADAYSTSSLPTTIDLNDTSAANIRSYYSSLNNLSTSERQGNNLLKNLKTILKNGQKYYSYDSGNAIWQIYEIADRDWSKSPASSTTYGTYNSGTNKITNYTYGTSSSSSKNNPYIHALYINRNVTNQTTAWDDHQQTQWGINREHVWPKAEGFETSGAGGARGDPMHLMAGNGYANNIHSNYYYGYVNTSSSYTNCGSKYSNISGNLLGKSKTLGGSTNVFEPQDCDKGDIARAIFYMVARYNYVSGSDSDGIDSNNPNLALTQSLSDWASSGYSSTTSKQGKMGIMTDLLAWHHADPVDEYEIHRNNLLYTNYTNNRNPFIDFPEWADFIWGSVNYSGSTYISNDTNPTGYATPSSDTINGYNSGGSTISVTGVNLNTASTSVEAGSDVTLTATVAPSNATNQTVTWSTSDASVATVSGGIVTGVAEGNATITVTTSDGGYTATCTVTVTASSGGGGGESEGTEDGSVTAANGAFAGWTGVGLGTKYADGAAKFDTSGDNVYKTDIFSGNVSSNMTKLVVTVNGKFNGTPAATSSYMVEAIDSSGNAISQHQLTGADVVTTSYGDAVFTIETDLSGCTGIRVTYVTKADNSGNWGVKSISWVATYSSGSSELTLESIAVKTAPTKTTYNVGDDFEPSGLVITATYSDSSTVDVPFEDNEDLFEFDPADDLQTTDVSVTISYGGKTCSQSITVNSAPTLTWTAPTIDVYSGSSLSGTDVNGWAVTYDDGAGHQTVLTYSQVTVKLGGSIISIPHTWAASDDSKTLTVSYSTLTTSESSAVKVTQSINNVYMETPEEGTWSNTLTETKWTAYGVQTLNGKEWTAANPNSDGNYIGWSDTKGQQFGKAADPCSTLTLSSSGFSGTISTVKVTTSGASSVTATLAVTVDNTAFKSGGSESISISATSTEYTFTGTGSGTIVVTWTNTSQKALYLKGLSVTYQTSGEPVNIANSDYHKDSQRTAVEFAETFNTAMSATNGCTTGLDDAWSTCSSAYNAFKSDAASLGSTEEEYAKNLVKYATAQYSDDSGEACIERMMKTYEICVSKYGKTAFMQDLVSVGRNVTPTINSVANNSTTLVIAIVSVMSFTAIGGYYYIRKRKHN